MASWNDVCRSDVADRRGEIARSIDFDAPVVDARELEQAGFAIDDVMELGGVGRPWFFAGAEKAVADALKSDATPKPPSGAGSQTGSGLSDIAAQDSAGSGK